jgi:cold shock protein
MKEQKIKGKVIWFNSKMGYGFLSHPEDKDIFVHWSDIETEGYKTLKDGQEVEYLIGLNNRKQPKAIEVDVK